MRLDACVCVWWGGGGGGGGGEEVKRVRFDACVCVEGGGGNECDSMMLNVYTNRMVYYRRGKGEGGGHE